MLLVISDLHWVDETAGEHNLPTAAYWISAHGAEIHESLPRIMDQVIEEICHDFSKMPFVKQWIDIVDQDWIPPSASGLSKLGAWALDRDFDEYRRDEEQSEAPQQRFEFWEGHLAED